MDRRELLLLGAALAASPETAASASESPEIIPLWSNGAPGGEAVTVKETAVERATVAGAHDRAVSGITRPSLTVHRPARPNGAALLLIPGGGYRWLAVDKEGHDAAVLFSGAGVTCFVLSHRLPGEGWAAGPDVSLQDAQRAMRLIRRQADRFGIDAATLGVMGFSAGGHVAASLANRHMDKVYEATDDADGGSARPAYAALLYPVVSMAEGLAHAGSRHYLLGDAPAAERIAAYSMEKRVTPTTPPTFIVHAADDPSVPVGNSLALFAALKAAKVLAELHVFEEGGHGFGLRLKREQPGSVWPELFVRWGNRHALLRGARLQERP